MDRSNKMRTVIEYNNGKSDWEYKCIDAYVKVKHPQKWKLCPNCGLIPKIWQFDNGRSTACGCGKNQYNHFSIHAESVMSVYTRNNSNMAEYDSDKLRKNWNHWVETGEIVFERGKNKRY